jgi:hypothetical protein
MPRDSAACREPALRLCRYRRCVSRAGEPHRASIARAMPFDPVRLRTLKPLTCSFVCVRTTSYAPEPSLQAGGRGFESHCLHQMYDVQTVAAGAHLCPGVVGLSAWRWLKVASVGRWHL